MSSASGIAQALVVLLTMFSVLAFVDGVLVHLVRHRLHTRPESRTEHLLHTARAIAFVPALMTVFADAQGALLVTGIMVLLVDEGLAMADAIVERRSRRALGGLATGEYLLHLGLTGTHWAAIALALVLRFTDRDGALMKSVSMLLLPGAIVIAVLHVGLALRAPNAPTSLRQQVAS